MLLGTAVFHEKKRLAQGTTHVTRLGTAAVWAGIGMWEVLVSGGGSAPFPLLPNNRSNKPSSPRPFGADPPALWPLFKIPCAQMPAVSLCPQSYVQVDMVYLGTEEEVPSVVLVREHEVLPFLSVWLWNLLQSQHFASWAQYFMVTAELHSVVKLDFFILKIST